MRATSSRRAASKPSSVLFNVQRNYLAGDYDQALQATQQVLTMVPDFVFALKDQAI